MGYLEFSARRYETSGFVLCDVKSVSINGKGSVRGIENTF